MLLELQLTISGIDSLSDCLFCLQKVKKFYQSEMKERNKEIKKLCFVLLNIYVLY